MVCNQLQPYIHKIDTLPSTAICIDFFFSNNNKSCIISVYLPSNHPALLKSTQTKLLSWITKAKARCWHIIITGDFNANQYRDKKLPIFTNLNAANLTSLMDFYNIQTPTWHEPNAASQIDDFWITSNTLLDFDYSNITSAMHITDSDHSIINTIWHTNFLSQKCLRNKKKKKKIYLYEKIISEDWEAFTNLINDFLETRST